MSWLDTMRRRHSNGPTLVLAVADRLYRAHSISGGLIVQSFSLLPASDQDNWKRRARNLLAHASTEEAA